MVTLALVTILMTKMFLMTTVALAVMTAPQLIVVRQWVDSHGPVLGRLVALLGRLVAVL